MNRKTFETYLAEHLGAVSIRAVGKGKEYAEDANAFTNFEKGVAISLHDEPEAVCWEYLCKHLQSIKDMVNAVNISGQVTGYPTREMLYEKVGDAVLYLILLQAMFDKRIKEYEAENSVTL